MSDLKNKNYGIIHSNYGTIDGVSIVMRQIEYVLINYLNIPSDKIKYLVGKTDFKNKNIYVDELLYSKNEINKTIVTKYSKGINKKEKKELEQAIEKAKIIIKNFIESNDIDIIIAHNTSHPENFILSVAISRYLKERYKTNKKRVKYIVWWHDSHLERKHFIKCANNIKEYRKEGLPGCFVDYIIFINSLQFNLAKNFFKKNNPRKDYYNFIKDNFSVIYNSSDNIISKYRAIFSKENRKLKEIFFEDYKIKEFLKENKLKERKVLFCLQHTRIVKRKRIDFAIQYLHEFLKYTKKKAIYFLVDGNDYDNLSSKLIELNNKLNKENKKKVYLFFTKDYNSNIEFKQYPIIFAYLKGISTYFSEYEGFGNNLLEILSSGLIPIIYEYPVFKSDLSNFGFNLYSIKEFNITEESIRGYKKIIKKRKKLVNKNIKILEKNLSHKIISEKLKKAIESKDYTDYIEKEIVEKTNERNQEIKYINFNKF